MRKSRNERRMERQRGSEIKAKCNGERVPPTVLVSSGRRLILKGRSGGLFTARAIAVFSPSVPQEVNKG